MGVSAEEIKQCQKEQSMLRKQISSMMLSEGIDAWISPSTTSTAPLGLGSTGSPLMSLPWTNAGLPAITVPNSIDDNGLAFGLQIVGKFEDDMALLSTDMDSLFC